MEFYLVRHGSATSAHEDPRRPLSGQGRGEVERVARAAAARGVRVSRILHSDKLRAKETADILARFLSPGAEVREFPGLSPDDDPVIAQGELEADAEPLMLVGHLPHLGRLTSLLLRGDSDGSTVEFQPATMVCFSRSGRAWKLQWILAPESA